MADLEPRDPPSIGQLRFVLRDNPGPGPDQLRILQVYEPRKDENGYWPYDWYDIPLVEDV